MKDTICIINKKNVCTDEDKRFPCSELCPLHKNHYDVMRELTSDKDKER